MKLETLFTGFRGDKGKTIVVVGVGILNRILTLVTLPLYTRSLSPEEFGLVGFASSLILMMSILSSLSLPSAAARFVLDTNGQDERRNLLGTVLSSVLAISIVLTLCLVYLAQIAIPVKLQAYSDTPYLLFMALSLEIILRSLSVTLSAFGLSRRKHYSVACAEFCEQLIRHGILIAFLILGCLSPVTYFLGGAGGVGVMLIVLVKANIEDLRPRWDRNIFRRCLRFSMPLVMHSSAYAGIHYVDRILLAPIVEPASLGKYHLAYSLVFAPFAIVILLAKAWTPLANIGFQKNKPEVYRAMSSALSETGIFVALGTAILLPVIISIFFGKGYQPPRGLIETLIAAELFYLVYTASVTPLNYFQRHRILPLITGVALIVNIAGVLLLAPKYGVLGAAVATLLAFFVLGAGTAFVSFRRTGESISRCSASLLVTACLFLLASVWFFWVVGVIGVSFAGFIIYRLVKNIRFFFATT